MSKHNTNKPLSIEQIEDYLEYSACFRDYDFVDTDPDLIDPSESDLVEALSSWGGLYTGTLRIQVRAK